MLLSKELYNFLLEEYKINRTVKHYSTSELLHIMNSDNYDLLFSVLEKQNRDLLTSINYDKVESYLNDVDESENKNAIFQI